MLDLKDVDEQTKQEIGEHLVESAIELSKEKFSSNVIEKVTIFLEESCKPYSLISVSC